MFGRGKGALGCLIKGLVKLCLIVAAYTEVICLQLGGALEQLESQSWYKGTALPLIVILLLDKLEHSLYYVSTCLDMVKEAHQLNE